MVDCRYCKRLRGYLKNYINDTEWRKANRLKIQTFPCAVSRVYMISIQELLRTEEDSGEVILDIMQHTHKIGQGTQSSKHLLVECAHESTEKTSSVTAPAQYLLFPSARKTETYIFDHIQSNNEVV